MNTSYENELEGVQMFNIVLLPYLTVLGVIVV